MTNSKLLSIFFLFFFSTVFASSTSLSNIHKCPKQQSEALLLFKHSLSSFNYTNTDFTDICKYPLSAVMMSWDTSTDCCNWDGVTCDDSTSDVIKLDLSCGMLQGTLHPNTSLFNLPHLQKLDLGLNAFYGHIPSDISINLPHLTYLNLANNKLNGTLPSWLFTSPSLQYLSLGYNMFSGNVPFDSFYLPSLQKLELNYNQLSGQIDMQTFPQLTNLTRLFLSFNNFSGELELDILLSSLTNLEELNLSYSGFSVTTRNTNHYVNPGFIWLGLASCKLRVFPNSLRAMKLLEALDLSSNEIHGQLPQWAGEIGGSYFFYLDLSHNFIIGLPQFQWYALLYMYLQSNLIQGPFPPSICNMSRLGSLDMSNNRFGGSIPQCFGKITSHVDTIDMRNNSFQGTIPDTFEYCRSLRGLILNGNQLRGEVPRSLSKCSRLSVLDLGNNHLNGTFPSWLESLPNLQVLVLKSNNFHGHIHPSATVDSPFPSLRVLDLTHNGFVDQLPSKYFQNFNSMKNVVKNSTTPKYLFIGVGTYYSFFVAVKGLDQDFPQISVDYTNIDLSNNSFEGKIPNVIGCLNSLIVLNLSHNSLIGPIPHALGNLSEIESLDLSWNQLSGEIPQSLADIKTLEVLNLSQNLLVGHIPQGSQFTTFEGNSFGGNPRLCGTPLLTKCSEYSHEPEPQLESDEGFDEESGDTGIRMWNISRIGDGISHVVNKKSHLVQCNC